MASSGTRKYIIRFAVAAIAALGIGWLFEIPLIALLAFFAAYGLWSLINTVRLSNWLNLPDSDVPRSFGIWALIFTRIGKLRKTGQKKKKQFKAVIQDFQSLTDALPDATLVLNKQDKITWFNNTASELLGLDVSKDLEQPVVSLFRGPDFARWFARQGEHKSRFETTSPVDENMWFSISVVDYRKGQRLLVLTDITEAKITNQMRRDFVANISHELRTPLTVLIGYLEMLQVSDEESQLAIGKMQAQTHKMEDLLADLLELSRLQTEGAKGREEEINVHAMLAQLKEQMDEISRGRHQITMRVEPDLLLRGIASDIESIFRNLLFNALNYTPQGGKITIIWRKTPEGAEFAVADTGIGIPKRDLPRLTERFYRVDGDRSRSSGGTGLGLAIVKHALKAHQATLHIDSELGEGSEFRCFFPESRVLSDALPQ